MASKPYNLTAWHITLVVSENVYILTQCNKKEAWRLASSAAGGKYPFECTKTYPQ